MRLVCFWPFADQQTKRSCKMLSCKTYFEMIFIIGNDSDFFYKHLLQMKLLMIAVINKIANTHGLPVYTKHHAQVQAKFIV
ncbi:hypothetical protein C3B55_00431 [Candidatus Pseudomonas adelgestsugas]|uniref:Uncharacterized protein n=1 Tax=Candidatus Pseudomonas adelgestsugas TaxID=1302376 RepID=A0ABX5R814_9PSED|nr:hypothetical protein C3B55_00431 [Candidatus Pseudomonas adelgestsugas]